MTAARDATTVLALLDRMRNWKYLNFYRPTEDVRYRHIDALFGEPGRNVIDWDLIENQYEDVMRPAEQEKILKFSSLLTNAVIFHTTLDMMMVIRELIAEDWTITLEDLAVLSPYLTARIQRFGEYATDEFELTPEPFDAHLEVDLASATTAATPAGAGAVT